MSFNIQLYYPDLVNYRLRELWRMANHRAYEKRKAKNNFGS